MRIAAFSVILAYALIATASPKPSGTANGDYNVKPFTLKLLAGISHLKVLTSRTWLPSAPEYPDLGATAGIDLAVVKGLQKEWLDDFDWAREQRKINSFKQYTVEIQNLTTHFVHEKSDDPDAIPLLLAHGWPGSFLEFAPIIKNLTKAATTAAGKKVSFNVVAPSIPGFAFSEAPPRGWNVFNTAQLWQTLMTEVLGYKRYAVHGTDFGCGPTYLMYDAFNHSVGAAHFVFLPFYPLSLDQLAAQNISLDPLEQADLDNGLKWAANGSAYFQLQSTKPNTLGFALYDNPVGQLSWIAEKYIEWSDPKRGTGDSVLTNNEILRSVSLYYLSKSFLSSIFIYFQNPAGFSTTYTKARTEAPMLFSAFRYNVAFWPRDLAAKTGNLVSYKKHERGGHFPGLDAPTALTEDLREIADYWKA